MTYLLFTHVPTPDGAIWESERMITAMDKNTDI